MQSLHFLLKCCRLSSRPLSLEVPETSLTVPWDGSRQPLQVRRAARHHHELAKSTQRDSCNRGRRDSVLILTTSSGLQVMAEFRRHSSDGDPARSAANLQLAKDYTFLLRSIREHKASLSAASRASRISRSGPLVAQSCCKAGLVPTCCVVCNQAAAALQC